jgi:hypothetical protein
MSVKMKVVLREKKLRVYLDEDNEKKSSVIGETDEKLETLEYLPAGSDFGHALRTLAYENTQALDRKLHFYNDGDEFIAKLKFLEKDETPDPSSPLT